LTMSEASPVLESVAFMETPLPTVSVSEPVVSRITVGAVIVEFWTVSAPEEVRIARTMHRDNVPEEQVRKRMAAQMAENVREEKSDIVVLNDGLTPVEDLCRDILHRI